MNKATNISVNIEKMDNGWTLFVSSQYSAMEDQPFPTESNIREVWTTLEEVLKRVVELS